jgi:hypothetical protein
MSGPAPTGLTPPNFRTARLVGIFNVNFGAFLLLCGLCFGGYTLTLPIFGRMLTQVTEQAERQGELARKAELDAADEQEKAAKTDKEKIEAAARRLEIERRPKSTIPVTVDFTKMGFADPQFIAWTWVDVLSGIVLNLMMIASGIGLLHWQPAGRTLGVWTAVAKIVRLFLIYGYFILAIVPPFCRKMGVAVAEMMTQQPGFKMPGGVPPGEFFAKVYTITYSAMGLGVILLGVIYPALVWWILTRPGVKSACSGRWKVPKEPNQPW